MPTPVEYANRFWDRFWPGFRGKEFVENQREYLRITDPVQRILRIVKQESPVCICRIVSFSLLPSDEVIQRITGLLEKKRVALMDEAYFHKCRIKKHCPIRYVRK